MHFGELGNCAYLRPNYVKAVADLIKELGGIPFLTDCNTLYPGSRRNAIDHLTCAEINGFNSITTGCHVIIADGLRGTDDIEIPVENGEYCKTALVGRALMDADILISLSHFKGHEMTGFGGAIKNIGMGAAVVLEKCSNITTARLLLTMNFVAAADAVQKNAAVMPFLMAKTVKPQLTLIYAWVADVALVLAPSTLSRRFTTVPTLTFVSKWLNTLKQFAITDHAFTSASLWTFRRIAIVMAKMTLQCCRTSEC